jgi:hypothetical protein
MVRNTKNIKKHKTIKKPYKHSKQVSRITKQRNKNNKKQKKSKYRKLSNKNKIKKKMIGGNDPSINLDKPLNNYFIFSSHNTELHGSQIKGYSSDCIIYDEFLKDSVNGGCIELDFSNVKKNVNVKDNAFHIIVGHMDTKKDYTFQECMKQIVKYYYGNGTFHNKFPLIINIDANGLLLSLKKTLKPNDSVFYNLFDRDMKIAFQQVTNQDHINHMRTMDGVLDANRKIKHLKDLKGQILLRWGYSTEANKFKKNLLFKHPDINTAERIIRKNREQYSQNLDFINKIRVSYINFDKTVDYGQGKLSPSIAVGISSAEGYQKAINKISKHNIIRTYPKFSIGGYNYNYYIHNLFLTGIPMIAINLQIASIITIVYNAFFDKSHYIEIPNVILEKINNKVIDIASFADEDDEIELESSSNNEYINMTGEELRSGSNDEYINLTDTQLQNNDVKPNTMSGGRRISLPKMGPGFYGIDKKIIKNADINTTILGNLNEYVISLNEVKIIEKPNNITFKIKYAHNYFFIKDDYCSLQSDSFNGYKHFNKELSCFNMLVLYCVETNDTKTKNKNEMFFGCIRINDEIVNNYTNYKMTLHYLKPHEYFFENSNKCIKKNIITYDITIGFAQSYSDNSNETCILTNNATIDSQQSLHYNQRRMRPPIPLMKPNINFRRTLI